MNEYNVLIRYITHHGLLYFFESWWRIYLSANYVIIGEDVAWSATNIYVSQSKYFVKRTIGNKIKLNFNRNTKIFFWEYAFEYDVSEIATILFRSHYL